MEPIYADDYLSRFPDGTVQIESIYFDDWMTEEDREYWSYLLEALNAIKLAEGYESSPSQLRNLKTAFENIEGTMIDNFGGSPFE